MKNIVRIFEAIVENGDSTPMRAYWIYIAASVLAVVIAIVLISIRYRKKRKKQEDKDDADKKE